MEAPSSQKGHPIPPFLAKCYDMVEDQGTDSIISWSPNDPSFVIWDVIAFEQDLLSKYFKHSNFSSFIRQLNTYGFRKTNPDRWEFANDGFVKGQKHLLRNISRRKATQSTQGNGQQKQPQQKNTSVGPCVEVGKFGLREEVEMLKSDKTVLMQELVKLRQHQKISESKLHCLRQRIQGMELHQQQMLSLLAMAVQSPGFLVQFLQQNESNWRIAETSKKRPLPALEQGIQDCKDVVPDGQIVSYQSLKNEKPTQNFETVVSDDQNQIVRYQSLKNENPASQDNHMSNMDTSQRSDPSLNGLDDLFMNIDFTSFGDGMSVLMEPNVFSENDGLFFLPELPEDIVLEQLLLGSPSFENIENSESNPLESLENGMEMESNNDASVGTPQDLESQKEQRGIELESTCNGTLVETTKTLDSLTKQMGLLVSENNMS